MSIRTFVFGDGVHAFLDLGLQYWLTTVTSMTMLLSADVHLHCSKFDIYAMATVTTELAPLSHVRSFCF